MLSVPDTQVVWSNSTIGPRHHRLKYHEASLDRVGVRDVHRDFGTSEREIRLSESAIDGVGDVHLNRV